MPKSFLITNKRYVSNNSGVHSNAGWQPPSELNGSQSRVTSDEQQEDDETAGSRTEPDPSEMTSACVSGDDHTEVVEVEDPTEKTDERDSMTDDTDDMKLISPSLPITSTTARQARETDEKSPFPYADYYKPDVVDRAPLPTYFPVPFQCQQRPLTVEERILLPLVHTIILQRQRHQQLQQQLQAAAMSKSDHQTSALQVHSLDGAAAAQQTSPAEPVGASVVVDGSPNSALFSCSECGRAYSTASNLARHRQSHRPPPCSAHVRPRSPPSPPDRRLDTSGAGPGGGVIATTRKCPHCDKVYASAPAYSMHVRTHSQGCECPQCGKRFSRPWLLQGHIRTHTGEKPFRCPHCGKTFADKSNLRAHIQTHSTDKPHVCGRCGKAFALRSYLYKHEESSCMRSHRLYHGYAFLHHQPQYHHHDQPQQHRQRSLSPVIRTTSISQIPRQL